MPYSQRPRSAYLHIPFCHRRCYYCDFAVVPLGDRARADDGPGSASIHEYLGLLVREIASAPVGPPLSTVYLGGGTPSLLTANQIGSLLAVVRNHYGLQQGAEITLEMDPASFDQQKLQDLIGHGINRVSLGGQSFDDAVLLDLGRRHRSDDLREACLWMQEAHRNGSLRSWSLDLIQNLPGQTLDHWADQLQQAIATGAPHLSVYDLSVEPGTVFERRRRRGDLALPSERLAVDLMALTRRQLAAAGLSRYEISNYARPGHASRHNRVYWSGAGWWGFGMGATSGAFGERVPRPRTREGYRAWLDEQDAVPRSAPSVGHRFQSMTSCWSGCVDVRVWRWTPSVAQSPRRSSNGGGISSLQVWLRNGPGVGSSPIPREWPSATRFWWRCCCGGTNVLVAHPLTQCRCKQLASLEKCRAKGRLPWGESQQVGGDANLPVAVITSANADHRDGQASSDSAGKVGGDVL